MSYKFHDYVNVNDMILVLNKNEFDFSTNGYKKRNSLVQFDTNQEYTVKLIEKEFREYELTFTTFEHKINFTSFNLNSLVNYYYKDNIVILNQKCKLDNIFIREIDSERSYYYRLFCDYDNSEQKSYCEANYDFTNTKYNTFQFFIGNPRNDNLLSNYFLLKENKKIFNAIKDSTFSLGYKNSIVTITSENFPMDHINFTEIDKENYIFSKDFIKIHEDLIQFNLEESNITKNYLTKLERIDHPYDRIGITIKNYTTNMEIIERECGEYLISYIDACIPCDIFAQISDINKDKIWYQDGVCVSSCNFSAGYSISSHSKHYCYKCDLRTKINDYEYVCGCLEGTVKSFDDDCCYLPESDEIKDLLNKKKNAQCYREDGKTHNYCNNDNTQSCDTYSVSGYLFPKCICKEGFTGKYCEFSDTSINLPNKMDIILSNSKEEIDDGNITIISNIRGVIFFLELDGKEYMTNLLSYIDRYIYGCIKNIENIINGKKNKTSPQIYDVLELAIYFLKYRITYSNSARNLQEDKDNLDYILKYVHYANFYGNKNISQKYNIQSDGLDLTTFITYKKNSINSDDFRHEMGNTEIFKIMEYIDINTNTDEDLIFVTLINGTLFEQNDKDNIFGIKAYFSTNNSIEEDDLSKLNNLTYYVSSKDIHFNFHLAQYYQNKKINIYDKKDQAFVEPCYLSKEFDFDLTQKYRKKNVFQKLYYGSEVCNYNTFLSNINTLQFNCNQFDEIKKIENLYYGILYFNIQKDEIGNANKVYNLPTKCTKKIENLGGNFAFWLFLIICALEILYIIGINILTLGSLKRISFRKGLVHDELYYHIQRIEKDEEENSNDAQLSKNGEKKNVTLKTSRFSITDNNINVEIDKYNKNLVECILLNFKELHPVATLFRVSIISPLILHSWFFVFNSLALFGFNALIYYEGLIEKRIYDKKRNNFDYPMRKEFHKIILSILCQIVLTLLIKLLIMVKLEQRQNLKISLTKCTLKGREEINNDIVSRVEQFQDEMLVRRLIGAFIILVLLIFFFYYSVAFCGIYIKTQINWFYSGIWSLFWNWVVFSPIYIVIISYIENKKYNSFDPLVYNLKRLFFF